MSDFEQEPEINEDDLTDEEYLQQRYIEEENKYKLEQIEKKEKSRLIHSEKYSMKKLIENEIDRKEAENLSKDAVGALALVTYGKNFARFTDAVVLDDNRIIVNVAGKQKEYTYWDEPPTVTIDMKKYWKAGGMWWKIKYFFVSIVLKLTGMMTLGTIKFNLFLVKSDGEYCLDISKDWTPLLLAKRLEEFLKLQGKMLKANIKTQLLADQRDFKQYERIVLYFIIAICLIVIANLFVLNGGKL